MSHTHEVNKHFKLALGIVLILFILPFLSIVSSWYEEVPELEDIKEKMIEQEVLHKKRCEEMESKYRALRGRYRFLLHKLKKNAPKTYRIFNELETNNI